MIWGLSSILLKNAFKISTAPEVNSLTFSSEITMKSLSIILLMARVKESLWTKLIFPPSSITLDLWPFKLRVFSSMGLRLCKDLILLRSYSFLIQFSALSSLWSRCILKWEDNSWQTFIPRTLLPSSSNGGEKTPRPNSEGRTAVIPPPTPLFAGNPIL